MFKKIYIEITNLCNLACEFCHGTKRKGKTMTVQEFKFIAERVKPYGNNFFLHVMGEPLSHPDLAQILSVAEEFNMPVTITTNGTLINSKADILLNAKALRKISISLHSFEGANSGEDIDNYIKSCIDFAKRSADKKKICVLRLWNLDGEETKGANLQNEKILQILKESFPEEWKSCYNSQKLCEYVF